MKIFWTMFVNTNSLKYEPEKCWKKLQQVFCFHHSHGYAHSDIKPENIYLNADHNTNAGVIGI